jgi:tetratricopeptide (TPR) repeat protein
MIWRNRIAAVIGIALAAIIIAKSISVFTSELPLHRLKQVQAAARDRDLVFTNDDLLNQIAAARKASRRSPSNPRAHFELGRALHRVAHSSDIDIEVACVRADLSEKSCSRTELLSRSIQAYEEAARHNRLDGLALFWATAARISNVDKKIIETPEEAELLSAQLEESTRLLGPDPGTLREAGDLQARLGKYGLAELLYARSLEMSLDGLPGIIGRLVTWPDWLDRLGNIVPETAEARFRLSNQLAEQWRFDLAQKEWDLARSLAGMPIPEQESGNLVANGRFFDRLGNRFLDWTLLPQKGVEAVSGYKDEPGMRFILTKAVKNYYHLTQVVPVEPGKSYEFHARINPSGSRLRPGSEIGFEVVHPYDFSIWSTGQRCRIESEIDGPNCVGMTESTGGSYDLSFEFTPPQPLRAVTLRFFWAKGPDNGEIRIDEVRIAPVQTMVEETEADDQNS